MATDEKPEASMGFRLTENGEKAVRVIASEAKQSGFSNWPAIAEQRLLRFARNDTGKVFGLWVQAAQWPQSYQ